MVKRRTAAQLSVAHRTERCEGKGKGHAGDGNAGDNSPIVAVQDTDRPEHNCAGDAIAGGGGNGATAREQRQATAAEAEAMTVG